MASENFKKSEESAQANKKNFRRSMTWDPADHSGSLNRAVNFITAPMSSKAQKAKKKTQKKRSKAMSEMQSKSGRSGPRRAMMEYDESDAKMKQLTFSTNVPERIIREVYESVLSACMSVCLSLFIRHSLVVFDKFDKDQDGFITKQELGGSLHDMGIQTNQQQLDRIMV